MAEQRQVPVAMPTDELADLLSQVAEAVGTGDSLEGWIQYSIPDPDDWPQVAADPRPMHMVIASIRTGNRNGQGGMILLGELADVTPGYVRSQLDQAIEAALPLAGRRVEILLRALRTELAQARPSAEPLTLSERIWQARSEAQAAERGSDYDPAFADRLSNGGYDHG